MDFFQEGKEFHLKTEYAASDRGICKCCNKKIYKDSLKLAYIIYQECYINPQWHHFRCLSQLPHNYPVMIQEDIVGYQDLDEIDQKLILDKLVILNRRDNKHGRMGWNGKLIKDDGDQDYQPSDDQKQSQSQSSSFSNYSENDSNIIIENQGQKTKNQIKKQPIKQAKFNNDNNDEEQEKQKEKSRLNAVKLQNWKNILKKKQEQ